MMNSPNLPGVQPGRTGDVAGRGVGQGFGRNPMSPTRAEAGCAGVNSNVPVPPSKGLLETHRMFPGFKVLLV